MVWYIITRYSRCPVNPSFSVVRAGKHFLMIVTWNLTKLGKKHAGVDALVLSIGKSGRTWLRVLLNKYISLHYVVPFDTGDLSKYHEAIPSIGYSHELWTHFSAGNLSQRIRGKFIIPEKLLLGKKVVLLYRDPRDVAVSLYFQKTRRSENRLDCTISTFIRDRKFGINNIIKVMNVWHERLLGHPQCLWLSYEQMRSDTLGSLIRVLEFLGINNPDSELAKEAIDFAKFENMKAMEARGDFKKKSLQPGNPEDSDSFKVREGKVGGYKRHFSEADLKLIDTAMFDLDVFYGYKPNAE